MKIPILLALLSLPASAVVNIDYVTVGNAGNAADPLTGYGSVSYTYNIGKYEVTNAQYVAFLNAAATSDPYNLYNPYMDGIYRSGSSGGYTYSVRGLYYTYKPISNVSWYDAARFANWIQNGQQTGTGAALTAETGAYTLNGATSGIITKNVDATVWIPSESEWYKAAFYDYNSGTYHMYANGQDAITGSDANYNDWNNGINIGNSTNVGYYSTASPYGTYDQNGNVNEWLDAINLGAFRTLRGGSYGSGPYALPSTFRYDSVGMSDEGSLAGFRLAGSPIPEPTTALLTLLSATAILRRRR